MKMRVPAPDIAQIAFEVLYVDWVEADDGCVEAHIGFCQAVTEVEWPAGFGEVCFCAVEGLEELGDGLLIGFF